LSRLLKRLTGEGDHPNQLDTILYEDRVELTRARIAEDKRLIAVVEKYDEAGLANLHSYNTTSGMPQSQVLSDILLHLFNHQTHHRGQAHACLSILTGGEPPSLDCWCFNAVAPRRISKHWFELKNPFGRESLTLAQAAKAPKKTAKKKNREEDRHKINEKGCEEIRN
jgi:hypothetical protein